MIYISLLAIIAASFALTQLDFLSSHGAMGKVSSNDTIIVFTQTTHAQTNTQETLGAISCNFHSQIMFFLLINS